MVPATALARPRAAESDFDQFARILRRGPGADAEDAAIGERPVEGIDRIGEAALLAHLLEQARRQAAAEHRGEDLERVMRAAGEGQAGQAEHEMDLFLVAADARFAAAVLAGFAREGRGRRCRKRSIRSWRFIERDRRRVALR